MFMGLLVIVRYLRFPCGLALSGDPVHVSLDAVHVALDSGHNAGQFFHGVHNGGEAMDLFPKIKDLPPEEQTIARKNLLEYCKLDTYAMVKVWEELVRSSQ